MNKTIIAKELLTIAKDLTASPNYPYILDKVYRNINGAIQLLQKLENEIQRYDSMPDALLIGEDITESWIPDIETNIADLQMMLKKVKQKAGKIG